MLTLLYVCSLGTFT